MTDSQVKYQSLMEEQRHNLAVEQFSKQEQESKRIQAEASMQQAESARGNMLANLMNARSNQRLATAREKEVKDKGSKIWADIGFGIASFVLPDANTALRSGAEVVSSLFG